MSLNSMSIQLFTAMAKKAGGERYCAYTAWVRPEIPGLYFSIRYRNTLRTVDPGEQQSVLVT